MTKILRKKHFLLLLTIIMFSSLSFFFKIIPLFRKKEITLGVENLNYYPIIATDLNNQIIGFYS